MFKFYAKEYRISLRADNADLRLTQKAIDAGLITNIDRIVALKTRQSMIEDRIDTLKNYKLFVREWASLGGDVMTGSNAYSEKAQHTKKSAEEILQMPHVTLKDVESIISSHDIGVENNITASPLSVYDTVEASIKYKHYVLRQEKDMESWRKAQGLSLPPDIEYSRTQFPTMSNEELEKLNLVKPKTFAEASAISGMTPYSLVYLYHYIVKNSKQRDRERISSAVI